MGELLLPPVKVGKAFAADDRDVKWCDHLAIGDVANTMTGESVDARFVQTER